jgi:hypothetical protein
MPINQELTFYQKQDDEQLEKMYESNEGAINYWKAKIVEIEHTVNTIQYHNSEITGELIKRGVR